jgi:hypothetical protein
VTIQQQVQWVLLPGGLGATPDQLRISVFVAPRLRTDEATTLAPFTDFLDWPAVVSAATFAVELPDATTVSATAVGPAPDSGLWKALFSATTPLKPFVFDDHADRPMVTYSTGDVLDFLRKAYATLAAESPDSLPPVFTRSNVEPQVPGLVEVFGPLLSIFQRQLLRGADNTAVLDNRIQGFLDSARAQSVARRADPALRGGPVIDPLPPDGTVAGHFERAVMFHRRPYTPVDLAPDEPTARAQFGDQIDFHQMLAALGDHSDLLRMLGLVVDLDVPRASIPLTGPDGADLRLRPAWTPAMAPGVSTDMLPATVSAHLEMDPEVFFVAAPRVPSPAGPALAPPIPMLALPVGRFRLEQVDTDGAALKALSMAATLETAAADPAPEDRPLGEPTRAGTPALRSSGLSLVETARATGLQSDFAQSLTLNNGLEVGGLVRLHAEDLVRGYRLDVLDTASTKWRSLHQRTVAYSVPGFPVAPVTDEGFFQVSLASAPTAPGKAPDQTDPVYIHESLVTWDGWSLSVPRAGKAISRDPRAPVPGDPDTQPQRVENRAMTAMGLSISAAVVAGTLPRLRFGRAYRVRARTVDLAGNGPTLAQADHLIGLTVTDTPILPAKDALVFRRFEPVPAPAIVTRQRFGEGASALRAVIRSNAGQTPDEYAAAFQQMDVVVVSGHPPYQPLDERHVAPPKAALQLVEAHGMLDTAIGSDGQPPDVARQAQVAAAYEVARREKGSLEDTSLPTIELVDVSPDPARPQHYAVHHEEQLVLPYLPDPWAAGAAFFGLPGVPPRQPFVVGYDAAVWYQPQPFRLRLAEGQAAPVWDPATRVLTVSLPKAASASIRVASVFGGDLRAMGLVDWWERELGSAALDATMRAASENRHWMITPWHEMTLVHAVQQPLMPPVVQELTPTRSEGSTRAEFFGVVEIDGASTDKIDLVATWNETVDDPASAGGPVTLNSEQVVFSLPLTTARLGRTDVDWHDVGSSLRDERILTFITLPRDLPPPGPPAHIFRDTKYRAVKYRVVATSPFREYFPQAWAATPALLSHTSDVQSLDIVSTARPAVPHLQYVVPTQGWDASGGGADPPVRRRRGAGLRVYLSRPWFSSGDGEMLGVIIGPAAADPQSVEYPLMTLLGQDPIRSGAPVEVAQTTSFPNAAVVGQRLRLRELPNIFVSVAGFVPTYDDAENRWFADIDIAAPESYFPFVRLALCRYQPKSLELLQLSQVVLADIVQTLPDRTLTVTRPDPATLSVTISGPAYGSIADTLGVRAEEAALGRMAAHLETRNPSIVDPVLAWQPVAGSEVVLTRSVSGFVTTWTGMVSLGGLPPASVRLAVTEQEQVASDEEIGGPGRLVGRVVYADAITLS